MSSLPKTPIKGDPETRRFLEAVRQLLNNVDTNSLTLSDLQRSSFWTDNNIPIPGGDTDNAIVDAPTVPVALTTGGVFQNIILEWDFAAYRGHAFTRIYRSATNTFESAVVIANVNGKVYADPTGPGASFYYWVTNVNVNDEESAPNQTAGTLGQTLQDTQYILNLLTDSITETQLFSSLGSRINLIDAADSVVNSVNARLKTLDSKIQTDITNTRDALRLELEGYTDDQISASELSLTQTFNNTLTGYVTSSYLANNYYTAAGTNSAIAAATLDLATKTELDGKVNTSTLTNEYYTRTATDSAIALATQNLVSQTQLNSYVTTATLTTSYYTKTQTDSAIAAATLNLATKTELSSYVTNASLDQNYYTITETDSAISAATLNLATKTELSGYVTTSNLTNNYYTKTGTDGAISAATQNLATKTELSGYVTNATLTTNYYTKTATDSAISSATQNLVSTSTLNNYVTTATLTNSYYTKTQTDSAISTSVNQVSARLNNFNGSTGVTIEQASTAQANSITGLQGQYTVKIDNNGYVSGFGLASTATNATPFSDFIVRADRFSIASPSGPGITPKIPFIVTTTPTVENGVTIQPGVYIDNAVIKDASITSAKIGALVADKITTGTLKVAIGLDGDLNVGTGRIIFDTGSFMKVQGIAFGSTNQFIEWFGPKLASFSQCTEANAITYIKRDGSAYFGGTLSAGVLRNAARTTGIGSAEIIELGPFGSNGGTRTVVLSYNYSYNWQITSALSYSGTPSAQIVLERANGSGGWTTLSTLNVTGTVNGEDGFGSAEPGFISIQMGGSTTFTDTSGGLSCTYRGRMVYRTLPSVSSSGNGFPTVTQSVGVISTEG